MCESVPYEKQTAFEAVADNVEGSVPSYSRSFIGSVRGQNILYLLTKAAKVLQSK